MNPYVVHKKIEIKASPEKVWDALTDPEKTKKYFFNCRVYSTWQPESPITFKGRIFLIKKIEMKGEIIKAEPGKLLKYTLKNSDGNSGSLVTDTITYNNGISTLTVSDDVGQGQGAEKRYERSNKSWDKVLQGLKELVESENTL